MDFLVRDKSISFSLIHRPIQHSTLDSVGKLWTQAADFKLISFSWFKCHVRLWRRWRRGRQTRLWRQWCWIGMFNKLSIILLLFPRRSFPLTRFILHHSYFSMSFFYDIESVLDPHELSCFSHSSKLCQLTVDAFTWFDSSKYHGNFFTFEIHIHLFPPQLSWVTFHLGHTHLR